MTGGEIQSCNDDPRSKPRGIRLKETRCRLHSLSYAMARNGTQWQRRSVALQKSRSTLRGISPIANKMPLGTKATASRRVRNERSFLDGARPDAMRDGTLMPSPLFTAPANAAGCTQRKEGDSPSFFAATADRCGRVAHTPMATGRRYRLGSTAWSQHRDRGSDWARMRQRALL